MNAYDYCHQLLEKVSHMVENYLKTVLSEIYVNGAGLFVKIEHTIINSLLLLYIMLDRLLENLELSLSQHNKMVLKKPLETFAAILQLGCDILHGPQLLQNAHSSEQELKEITERRISGMIFLYAQ
jgi:hypothetical protein